MRFVREIRVGPIISVGRTAARALTWLSAPLSLIAAALVVATTALISIDAYSPLPIMDQWGSIHEARHLIDGEFTLGSLFALHNEHRIVIPRLFFLADILWFKASNVMLFVLLWIIQLLNLAVLLKIARIDGRGPGLALAGIAVVLLFNAGQQENFTWAFQIQFSGVFLFANAAALAFVTAALRRTAGASDGPMALAGILAALGASGSMSNGVVIWPILLALGIFLGLSRRWLLATTLVGAVTIIAYFWNFQFVPNHSPLSYALSHPGQWLAYSGFYLGNLVIPLEPATTRNFGYIGLVLTAIAIAMAFRGKLNRPQLALLAVMLFVVASVILTGAGRLNLGVGQAMPSRYVTPTGLFWAAHLLLWTSLLPGLGGWRRMLSNGFFGLLLATGLYGIALAQLAQVEAGGERGEKRRAAEMALLSDVTHPETLRPVFLNAKFVHKQIGFLRWRGLSVYGDRRAAELGRPFTGAAVGLAAIPACRGAVTMNKPVPSSGGRMLRGTLEDGGRRAQDATVRMLDRAGRVAGYGLLASDNGPRPPKWIAFAHPDLVATRVVFAAGANIVCQFHPLPVFRVGRLGPLQAGEVLLPVKDLAMEPAWTPGGRFTGSPALPIDGPEFGSWSGGDGNMGRLSFLDTRPAGTRYLRLPFLTGPDPSRARLQLEALDGTVIATAQLVSSEKLWSYALFHLPNDDRTEFRVVARDAGNGWGEWLAIGAPIAGPAAPGP